ncbi:MAG: Rrf2 family transcriptional regulator [Candidatus Diapherotrites archaeon]|nr:Rrf2 family transcriptional regulator [Candidatus Diapherotrites archaeon]
MAFMDWDDVFLDARYLQIMYYLAKFNPSIQSAQIAQKFGLGASEVEERLVKLAHLDIVDYRQGEGYTLTDKGLMSLYNFHQNFNSR